MTDISDPDAKPVAALEASMANASLDDAEPDLPGEGVPSQPKRPRTRPTRGALDAIIYF